MRSRSKRFLSGTCDRIFRIDMPYPCSVGSGEGHGVQLLALQPERLPSVVCATNGPGVEQSGIRSVRIHVQQARDHASFLLAVWLCAVWIRRGSIRYGNGGDQCPVSGGCRSFSVGEGTGRWPVPVARVYRARCFSRNRNRGWHWYWTRDIRSGDGCGYWYRDGGRWGRGCGSTV